MLEQKNVKALKRRDFLKATGLALVGGLLAACQQPAAAPAATATKAATAAATAAATKAATAAATTAPAGTVAAATKAATQAPAQAGTVTATFWFNQPAAVAAFNKIVEKFHASQTKVRLNPVVVPGTEMATKLTTSIAGGEPPDAARLGGPVLNSLFIDTNQAAAMDDWDPQMGTYDWLPGIKSALTRNGKMYAMPVNSGAQAMVINADVYQAAGLDASKPPKTLDELLTTAGKITNPAQQTWGHYMPTAPIQQTAGDYFTALLYAYGAKEVSEDGKKVIWNSAEGVAALQFVADLLQKVKGMPVKQINEQTMTADFLTGKVGSIFVFPSQVQTISGAKFKSVSHPLPAGPKGSLSPIGFGTILIPAKAKNKDAAWEFAKFIGLSAENSALWNTSFGQLPPRSSYRTNATWQEYEKKNPLVPAYLEQQKTAVTPYFGPASAEIFVELSKAIEAVAFGQKTPKQAADESAAAAQVILDRELKKVSG
ncbi:MAG: extracellular solute-binding protein [Chloroflexota bacterium]